MKRREFLTGIAVGLALASPAAAQDIVDSILGQLRKQGYRSIVQERTLLGRVRIVADRKDGEREIILNPRTGEILRDLWIPVDGGSGTVHIIDDHSSSGHDDDDDDGGNHDDDDDDDDDDDHGDGGDDNSGHGGGDDDN